MERFELARKLAADAGSALRQCRPEAADIRWKSGHQDLVTYWDRKTEQLFRQEILSAFPRDSVFGEEYPASENRESGFTWYLDPIDGTTNFISQRRNYAVSVGCWDSGRPLFGLVLDVERQTLYWAERGRGAFRNGEPIRTSDRCFIPDLLLAVPGIQPAFFDPHPFRESLIRLSRDIRGVRSLGSVALELCQVAAGEADLLVAMQSSPWDHNAARIILEEAGGTISRLDGAALSQDSCGPVIASSSETLHRLIQHTYLSAT